MLCFILLIMFSRSLSGSTLPANWLIVVFKIALITFLLISTLLSSIMLSNVSPICSMLVWEDSSASSIKLLIKTFNVSNSVFQFISVAFSMFCLTTLKLSVNISAFSISMFLIWSKTLVTICFISLPNNTLCFNVFNDVPKFDINVEFSESNAVFKSDAAKISWITSTKLSTSVSSVCQLLTSGTLFLTLSNTGFKSSKSCGMLVFK